MEVIPKSDIVVIRWNVDKRIRHQDITILWKELFNEELKAIISRLG